jgi:hypothetical protein
VVQHQQESVRVGVDPEQPCPHRDLGRQVEGVLRGPLDRAGQAGRAGVGELHLPVQLVRSHDPLVRLAVSDAEHGAQ